METHYGPEIPAVSATAPQRTPGHPFIGSFSQDKDCAGFDSVLAASNLYSSVADDGLTS